jgi:F-type H+-transporting ATPase subunit alpha
MVEIKPDEISAILRQQLSNFNAGADLEEIGTILTIGDGIARVYGLTGVRLGELVEFENGVKAIAMNLEEDNVGVVLMGSGKGIKEGVYDGLFFIGRNNRVAQHQQKCTAVAAGCM